MTAEDEDVPVFDRVPEAVPAFDFDQVKEIVEEFFRVYDTERDVRGHPQTEVAAFYVMADAGTFDRRFEAVRDKIRGLDDDLLVVLQHRLGEDVIMVVRRPPIRQSTGRLNLFLLIATIITTTMAGAFFWVGYKKIEGLLMIGGFDASFLAWEPLLWGFVTFGFPLMAILGIHELGHWFVARRHKVRTSLPYFIPVPPPVPFGTFGAFISMKEPIPDRKALFDIGAAGPVAGFVVTLPVLILGLVLTGVVAEELPAQPEIHSNLVGPDGTTWGWTANETVWESGFEERDDTNVWVETIRVENTTDGFAAGMWRATFDPVYLEENATVRYHILVHVLDAPDGFENRTMQGEFNATVGALDEVSAVSFSVPADAAFVEYRFEWTPPASGLLRLGDSLAFLAINWVVETILDTPDDVFIHPTAMAGWVGLLVTGFNLLPAGQLDGGHVARAVLGDRMHYASYASVALMFLLAFAFAGWIILAVLVLLLGVRHPPPLNDRTQLDDRRKVWAALVAILLVVTFVPIPLAPIP